MGVPTSEVGYTPAKPRREDHEVHKGHVVALGRKKTIEIRSHVVHIKLNVVWDPTKITPMFGVIWCEIPLRC